MNPGIYIFKISELFKNLERVKSNNESKEYYLTDVIELINNNGTVKTKKLIILKKSWVLILLNN